jgi:hypothetical protein
MPSTQLPGAQSVPTGAGEQVPSRSGWLQLAQGPAQAVLQQTPFAQWPLAHSLSAMQVAVSLIHDPFMQGRPLVQSPLLEQWVTHDAVASSHA